MRDKHITELVLDSRRIDIRQAEPSQVVSIPDHWSPSYSQHEIAWIEVNGTPVLFTLERRWTARLGEVPPSSAFISLYWVHPASRSTQVINYLRDTETTEEAEARLLLGSPPASVGGANGPKGTYPSPTIVHGLQRPSEPFRKTSQ
jgi:hypothetical protein